MIFGQSYQAHAAFVTLCAACRGEVQALELDADGKSILRPCGHKAHVKLVRNPQLRRS